MRVLRGFGWILVALAGLALLIDAQGWTGGAYRLSALGELWARLHRDSLLLLEPALDRHVWPGLWQAVVVPVLLMPTVLVFALPGIALIALSDLVPALLGRGGREPGGIGQGWRRHRRKGGLRD